MIRHSTSGLAPLHLSTHPREPNSPRRGILSTSFLASSSRRRNPAGWDRPWMERLSRRCPRTEPPHVPMNEKERGEEEGEKYAVPSWPQDDLCGLGLFVPDPVG